MRDDDFTNACHEAGHAVAADLRGGTVRSIAIKQPGLNPGHTDIRWSSTHDKRRNTAFVAFAGPWAEARASWTADDPIWADDASRRAFDEAVGEAFRENPDDFNLYEPDEALADAFLGGSRQLPTARDPRWHLELEALWPAMQKLARMVLRSDTSASEMLQALRDEGLL